jgi:hypothetical protein
LKINKLEIIKNLGAPLVTYFSVWGRLQFRQK